MAHLDLANINAGFKSSGEDFLVGLFLSFELQEVAKKDGSGTFPKFLGQLLVVNEEGDVGLAVFETVKDAANVFNSVKAIGNFEMLTIKNFTTG